MIEFGLLSRPIISLNIGFTHDFLPQRSNTLRKHIKHDEMRQRREMKVVNRSLKPYAHPPLIRLQGSKYALVSYGLLPTSPMHRHNSRPREKCFRKKLFIVSNNEKAAN